jgi:hypothetical protein
MINLAIVVFDPKHPTKEVKRLECSEIISTSRAEAQGYALTLCRAWIDGLSNRSQELTMDDKTREQLEKRMDELARTDAETHDPVAKAEVEAISRRLAGLLDNCPSFYQIIPGSPRLHHLAWILICGNCVDAPALFQALKHA